MKIHVGAFSFSIQMKKMTFNCHKMKCKRNNIIAQSICEEEVWPDTIQYNKLYSKAASIAANVISSSELVR